MNYDAIKNILNNWLIKNNFSARIRGFEEDFGWYHSDNTIVISVLYTEKEEKRWLNFLEEFEPMYDVPVFVSAFLHELGHSETYYDLNDEIIDEDEETKRLLEEEPNTFECDIYDLYYHLPMEIVATKWAINYMNTHFKQVKDLVYALKEVD